MKTAVVQRERLVRRLITSHETPVVLIDAPVGFGKSTVLGEWRGADDRQFACLTLGEHHDDPVALTASIAEAVGELEPVDDGVFTALHGAGEATVKVAIPRLLDSMRHWRAPHVLVLDDVHRLSDAASLSIIATLAGGLPSGSQLAIASRTEPSIHVGRMRANRDLVELTARDLAMTPAETDWMLRACGLRLRPASVELLQARTEGWPAGLYLAALSLANADDPDGAAARFAGDERVVADYLRDELISSLTPDALRFLTRTSILDELSGDLCDAVLGDEGSGEVLRTLARSNALISSLDSRDHSYRYHALLREMLESELQRLEPLEAADLHARAGRWYAERGDFDHAVPHTISTGDPELAGELIWSLAADYASAGRQATLERWLGRFTTAQIAATPTLCLVRATYNMSQGDGAQVEHWAGLALQGLEDNGREDGEALRVAASVIRSSGAAREGAIRMRADVTAAFDLLPEESPWRSICRLVEGVSYHLTADRERARSALEEGARRGAAGAPHIYTLCLAQLALVALDDDDVDEAARLTAESTAEADRHGLNDYPTAALVFAVAALVGARQGRAGDAVRDAKRAVRLLATLNELSPWYEVETRIALARSLALLEDVAGARAQLAAAGRLLRLTPDAPVLAQWLEQAWQEADSATAAGRWPLTPAELRLLRYLPTHLTFREIAARLVVSTNTVKTQARSLYGKLGVSSRAEAVTSARTTGLLETDDLPT
ncbi:MAG: hypothetical protein GEU88_04605 [Solirubrobacterales bacterium]|nr:hypothetical protein [Solirubrobacterales bacterium]